MSKKVLLSVAAVTLLAMTAFAGDYKYEDWPTKSYTFTTTGSGSEETKALIESIEVMIHIPYYVIIEPQDTVITLEQQGLEGNERFHFAGVALWYDGDGNPHLPTITANFNADLTVECVRTGNDISSYDGDGNMISVWTPDVSPSSIAALAPTDLTISCDVTMVNLLSFAQCSELHVADVLLYIMHQ